MPREPVRSLRHAVLAVAGLGALSLTVPACLWLTSEATAGGQVRDRGSQADGYDDAGHRLARPAQLRPGASVEVVADGFAAAEPVVLGRAGSAEVLASGRADDDGVFRYRYTVPRLAGAQSLTVLGTVDAAGGSAAGRGPKVAVFRFVVSPDRAAGR